MAAVIEVALDDLKGSGYGYHKKDSYQAMNFILSDTCEAYCLELKIDYESIREKADVLYRRFIAKND